MINTLRAEGLPEVGTRRKIYKTFHLPLRGLKGSSLPTSRIVVVNALISWFPLSLITPLLVIRRSELKKVQALAHVHCRNNDLAPYDMILARKLFALCASKPNIRALERRGYRLVGVLVKTRTLSGMARLASESFRLHVTRVISVVLIVPTMSGTPHLRSSPYLPELDV